LPDLFDYSFVELGLSLILFSLFIKLALAPFHLWSLDVYEGSPTSSTFFFAVIGKLSIFVLLVRLCYDSFFSLKELLAILFYLDRYF
jgi:NADH-quinone oxidoreductase subunit N